ncbi:MAG: DUF1844 domain-containing protein [Acidobacteriota bacterium]
MADKPIVINDRRRFTSEGELRPDAAPQEPRPFRPEQVESSASHAVEATGPRLVTEPPSGDPAIDPVDDLSTGPDDDPTSALEAEPGQELPPGPTAEQADQAQRAYAATIDRLDTAIRATNPGMDPIPSMSFDRVVQSLYMQALMQLGGAAEPGQTPQVDLMGARQTIDMLSTLSEKSKGNLTPDEETLTQSALFELHMGFLEVTQALARQAAARNPGSNPFGGPGAPPIPGAGGPSIVR